MIEQIQEAAISLSKLWVISKLKKQPSAYLKIQEEFFNTTFSMTNELRWVAIVSLALLSIAAFFQMAAMFPGRNKSLMTVGRRGKPFHIFNGEKSWRN